MVGLNDDNAEKINLGNSCQVFLTKAQETAGDGEVTDFTLVLTYLYLLKEQPMLEVDMMTGYLLNQHIERVKEIMKKTAEVEKNEKLQQQQLDNHPSFVENLKALGIE